MFEKLAVIEPVNLTPEAKEELKQYAKQVVLYDDVPAGDGEIARRIADADAVLVSYTSQVGRGALEPCENVRYIGMCCSLYSEESANVDIAYARERGIQVKGVRDYGDRGVVEYVLYQLIRILHGYDFPMWKEQPLELTRLAVGIVGLGTSGTMVAEALLSMGAKISYYSRSRKPEQEAKGMGYLPLDQLLAKSQVVITCLNKNVILLKEEQFAQLGNGKILMNTSIGPASDMEALARWLQCGENLFCCDTEGALGDPTGRLILQDNVVCTRSSSGTTKQAFELLSQKAINNIKDFLADQK